MVSKLFCSMFVMVAVVAFVVADDFSGVITKVDGDKITFQEMTKAKKGAKAEKVGDPKTLTVTDKTKFAAKKFDPDTKKVVEDDLKDGIKAEVFTKIDTDKGVNATVTIEDGKLTKVLVGGGKKKKAATE
jgi:hypothetical protein